MAGSCGTLSRALPFPGLPQLLFLCLWIVGLPGCREDLALRPVPPAACSLSDTLLVFQSVPLGECASPRSFTIAHPGAEMPEVSLLPLCRDYRIVQDGATFTASESESLTVTVEFCPTAVGERTCVISTGVPDCPQVRCRGTGLPAPEPVGACCDPAGGGCTVLDEITCASPAVWTGPWTNCNPNPCEPPGACCKNSDCVVIVAGDCLGTWLGPNTSCDPDNPCLVAACCDPVTGDCMLTLQAECMPPGIFYGDELSCSPNPCPLEALGACCDPLGACTMIEESECPSPGSWHGDWIDCLPNPCPQPQGACCAADGSCSLTLRSGCPAPRIWHGEWSDCQPNPCPPPPGACCVPNGTCTLTQELGCPEPRIFHAEWTSCSPNPCPQPPDGACCRDTTCTIDNRYDCEWKGGVYLGDLLPCGPCACTPCPSSPLIATASRDVTVCSGTQGGDACRAQQDRVGYEADGPKKLSLFIQFNLSAIPACATVTGAGIELFADGCDPAPPAGGVEISVSRILTEWNECSAGWSSPPSAPVSECRSHLFCAPPTYFGVGCSGLAQVVQEWVRNPSSNHGVRLDAVAESEGAVLIRSRRHLEAQTRPRLIVRFTCPRE